MRMLDSVPDVKPQVAKGSKWPGQFGGQHDATRFGIDPGLAVRRRCVWAWRPWRPPRRASTVPSTTAGAWRPARSPGPKARLRRRAWKPVTLPRAWNEDEAFKVDIHDLKGAIVWYRKRLVLPTDTGPAVGGKAFIEFEGVRQAGDVYVNGVRVGGHENGVTAFGVDATKALKPAPFVNVVAVRVDSDWKYKERATGSGFQWNNNNFNVNYGGIHRAVRLHLTGGLHQTLPLYSSLGTTGVYVWADGFDIKGGAATVHAESQVRNESDRPRTFQLPRDPARRRRQAGRRLRPARPSPWPRRDPHGLGPGAAEGSAFLELGLRLSLCGDHGAGGERRSVDAVVTRTGFRKTEFRNGMIFLNDRVMQVHGYAQRTSNEWPALGTDIPPWISDFSNGLMVESGGNLVRWMHITPAAQDVSPPTAWACPRPCRPATPRATSPAAAGSSGSR
jgi:beta-galactosidase